MGLTPQVLNDALQAYVLTFPNRKRLMEHIAAAGLTEQSDEITAKLDAVLKTAENYLYGYPGGVPWNETFERDYDCVAAEAATLVGYEIAWPDSRIFRLAVLARRFECKMMPPNKRTNVPSPQH